MGSHPILCFHSMVTESQNGLSQWKTAWWDVGYREANTSKVAVEVTGRGWSYLGLSFLLFLECSHCHPGICHLLGSGGEERCWRRPCGVAQGGPSLAPRATVHGAKAHILCENPVHTLLSPYPRFLPSC